MRRGRNVAFYALANQDAWISRVAKATGRSKSGVIRACILVQMRNPKVEEGLCSLESVNLLNDLLAPLTKSRREFADRN